MNEQMALDCLDDFLTQNPEYKPDKGYMLSRPFEHLVNSESVYAVWWVDIEGRSARGGCSYYIMPDGRVMMPQGGSGQPETVESIYDRWQRKTK